MTNILFISDIHAGHGNICKFRKKPDGSTFESEEEHFELVAQGYNSRVRLRDTVYFTGDIAFSRERLYDIGKWCGNKILILGNHDTVDNPQKLSIFDIINSGVFSEIHGIRKKYGFWITHAPIHPDELRGKYNIHGHTHEHVIQDDRYVNVCLDHTNMKPITLDEIRDKIIKRTGKF